MFIDDATSELMALLLTPRRRWATWDCWRNVYWSTACRLRSTDLHSIFQNNKGDHQSSDATSQFGRALEDLGIEGIQANSPQAKEPKDGLSAPTKRCRTGW